MCCEDFPLKVIATSCIFIMVADSLILKQLWQSETVIQEMAVPEVFHQCYKPQIRMRMFFTGYAINAAFTCFILTVSLILFDEMSANFDYMISLISDFMYIMFGPVLLTLAVMGLLQLPGIALDCHIDYVGTSFRVTDVFCLLLCLFISFCVLFIYGLTITGRISSRDLSDETSVSYQVFYALLSRRKIDYFKQRDLAERRARLREVMRLQ